MYESVIIRDPQALEAAAVDDSIDVQNVGFPISVEGDSAQTEVHIGANRACLRWVWVATPHAIWTEILA